MTAMDATERTTGHLTLEVVVYGVIIALAIALRLGGLGAHPLSDGEAAQALSAWHYVQGQPVNFTTVSSPLLFAAQVVLFALFGPTDEVARLLPALAGILLVALPWFLRRELGRWGALGTALLLAVSPLFIFGSRYAGGEILAVTCALAALVAYTRAAYPLLSAALALLLLSAPSAYTALLAAAIYILATRLPLTSRTTHHVKRKTQNVMPNTSFIIAFITTFVLAGTVFFIIPGGIGAAADLFPRWLVALKPGGDPWPWHHALRLLVVYEPLLLVAGLAGMGVQIANRKLQIANHKLQIANCKSQITMAIALVVTGAAALLSGGSLGAVLMLLLVMALLGGMAMEYGKTGMLEGWKVHSPNRSSAHSSVLPIYQSSILFFLLLTLPVAVHLYLELAAYADRGGSDYLWLALVAVLLLSGIAVLYAIWFGPEVTARSLGVFLLLVLMPVSLAIGTGLNHRPLTAYQIVLEAAPGEGLPDLVATLERASLLRQGELHTLPVTAQKDVGPMVLWALRHFERLQVVEMASHPDTPAVITPAEVTALSSERPYAGQDFLVRTHWRPQGLPTWVWMHWLLFRRIPGEIPGEQVILWVEQ